MRFVLLLVAAASALAFVTPQHAPPSGMARFWFGLIRKGPAWTAETNAHTAEIQRGHMENIGRLVESGELLLAGPFEGGDDLRGIFVYDVDDEARAQELVASDPAVASGRLVVELTPWWGPAALRGLLDTEVVQDEAPDADTSHSSGSDRDLPLAEPLPADAWSASLTLPARLEQSIVEASCGECQLGLDGDDCTLAIRFRDRVFEVSGSGIDDHGDAHGGDGFCNAIRYARVSGTLTERGFAATSMLLLPR